MAHTPASLIRVPHAAIWLLIALPTFLGGCAGIDWQRTAVLVDGSEQVVEIERAEIEPDTPPIVYGHPAIITPERIQAALAELRFEKLRLLNQDQTPPVVAKYHRSTLANAISDGLARCQPEERVRFRVENSDDALWIFSGNSITRGVAFVDTDGALNFAFDLIGFKPDPDQPQAYRIWSDPTARRVSRAQLLPGSYQRPAGAHELWVAFTEGSAAGMTSDAAADPTPEASEAGSQPESPSQPESQPERESLSGPESQPGTTPPQPVPLSDAEKLSRLRYLEELWKSGQLSEKAYREQRSKLLEDQ